MKKISNNFSAHGGMKELLIVALPMFISQSFDTAMIFTDRIFLAKLGTQFMSAAMAGGLTAFMMISFFLGLTSYTTALVAQYLGAGQPKKCGLVVTQAFIFSFAAYIPLLIFRSLGPWFFHFIGIEEQQLIHQEIYFNILMYGAIFTLLRNSLSCFFSGIGRTKVVTISSFIAMLVNIFFNYILIFGKFGFPALGIKGAAIGTVLGGLTSFSILFFAYIHKKYAKEFSLGKTIKFDKNVFGKLLRFGSSQGAEMFLNILAFNALVLTFHSCGLSDAAASTIVFNWDMVAFVPLIGIEIAVTSMVGRYMGSKNPDTAHKSVLSGLKIACCYSALMLILFLFLPKLLVGMFSPRQPDIIFQQAAPKAVFMLKVVFLYVFAESVFIVFTGALRGAGDTFWTMIISVILHWAMFVAAFILIKMFQIKIELVWITVVTIFVVFSCFIYLRYKSGKWKNLTVISDEEVSLVMDGFHEV